VAVQHGTLIRVGVIQSYSVVRTARGQQILPATEGHTEHRSFVVMKLVKASLALSERSLREQRNLAVKMTDS
jgi:hypothetical protein